VDLGLAGKAAVVTGGSRGIGRAVALRLAAEGCSVGICARNPEDLNRVVQEVRKQGVKACGVVADVSREGDIEHFVDNIADEFGKVDLLVANAGPHLGGRLVKSTPADWREAFELHVVHATRAIHSCVPYMRKAGGGAVTIIASISGWKPAPRPQYGTAKAAQIYLATELGRELAPERIRVNAVSPGSIIFPGGGWDSLRQRDPERVERFIQQDFPFGRFGTPEEVADVVVFLLSERASWINATNICVDGAQGRASDSSW
jgi:3-oxoacyl-[acyl-carrier protein] reductase